LHVTQTSICLLNEDGASLMPGFEKILPQYGLLRSSRAGDLHEG